MNFQVVGVGALLVVFMPQSLSPAQTPADALVRQLRDLPAPLPAMPRSNGSIDPVEQRRHELYSQLLLLGNKHCLPSPADSLMPTCGSEEMLRLH
jgi:hypothetical protein